MCVLYRVTKLSFFMFILCFLLDFCCAKPRAPAGSSQNWRDRGETPGRGGEIAGRGDPMDRRERFRHEGVLPCKDGKCYYYLFDIISTLLINRFTKLRNSVLEIWRSFNLNWWQIHSSKTNLYRVRNIIRNIKEPSALVETPKIVFTPRVNALIHQK